MLEELQQRVGRLNCLPAFSKRLIIEVLDELSDEDRRAYADAQLRLLEEFIEPLATTPQNALEARFAQLCRQLLTAENPADVAEAFGVAVPDPFSSVSWLEWAEPLQLKPAACMYCAANFLAFPASATRGAELTAIAISLIGQSLSGLDRHDRAVVLLEAFAGLQPQDYADHDSVQRRLQQHPLAALPENNRAVFAMTLAAALPFVRGRGDEQALVLLEAFAGL